MHATKIVFASVLLLGGGAATASAQSGTPLVCDNPADCSSKLEAFRSGVPGTERGRANLTTVEDFIRNQVITGARLFVVSDGTFDGEVDINPSGAVGGLRILRTSLIFLTPEADEGFGSVGVIQLLENGTIRVEDKYAQSTLGTDPENPQAGGGGTINCPNTGGGFTTTPQIGSDDCLGEGDPIVVDFGDRGYDLTGVDDGVRFDIDADGAPEQVAWTAPGSDDAFLAHDRNGNGKIDDGSELFGNMTVLGDGSTSEHGYMVLAEFDRKENGGNGNGYADYKDREFGMIMLWTDRDHDGASTSDELEHLRDRGIYAIALEPDEIDVVDEYGNQLAYVSPAYAWRRFRIDRIRTTDIFFGYRNITR